MATSIPILGPLKGARFLDRPNQFTIRALIEPEEEVVMAHLSDPSALPGLLVPDRRIWLRAAADDGRQTRWTAVIVQAEDGSLVSLDAELPVPLTRAAIEDEAIDELHSWHVDRVNHPLGRSRVAFRLSTQAGDNMLLDVINVTMCHDGLAMFPDAPSERATRHLYDFIEAVDRPGWHGTLLFMVQRNDAVAFAPARHVDPAFGEALDRAQQAGVRVLARRCHLTLEELTLGVPIPSQSPRL